MRWQGRRESDNVEDRRGQGANGGGLGAEECACRSVAKAVS